MVADVAKRDSPMLGYTVPYAVSNTLLTLWGLVIVLMFVIGHAFSVSGLAGRNQ